MRTYEWWGEPGLPYDDAWKSGFGGVDAALAALVSSGPYDGVLGFSQVRVRKPNPNPNPNPNLNNPNPIPDPIPNPIPNPNRDQGGGLASVLPARWFVGFSAVLTLTLTLTLPLTLILTLP